MNGESAWNSQEKAELREDEVEAVLDVAVMASCRDGQTVWRLSWLHQAAVEYHKAGTGSHWQAASNPGKRSVQDFQVELVPLASMLLFHLGRCCVPD